MERIMATEITDAVVGRTLIQYSHVGEDPNSPERRFDQIATLGGTNIVGVRHSDEDNHVALLLHAVLPVTARDENGQMLRDERGKPYMVPTDPPQGHTEIGFDEHGWIEVA